MDVAQGREYVLTLSCPDKPGIVYAVSSFLVQHSGNILDSQQYGESPDGRFFMRVHFAVPPQNQSPEESLASLQHGFYMVKVTVAGQGSADRSVRTIDRNRSRPASNGSPPCSTSRTSSSPCVAACSPIRRAAASTIWVGITVARLRQLWSACS